MGRTELQTNVEDPEMLSDTGHSSRRSQVRREIDSESHDKISRVCIT